MAYYGIPSAGLVLTASTANDTVAIPWRPTITAASVYGEKWQRHHQPRSRFNVATSISGRDASGGVVEITASPVGSATYKNCFGSMTGGETMSVAVTGVITSASCSHVNGAMFQANAGNDSIALGDRLSRVSATTFAGGAGNDIIGGYTNVNNKWTATTVSGATFATSDIEGGNGNDTVYLRGSAAYSAVDLNANKGNDLVDFQSAVVSKSIFGLGAGNDELSGQFESLTTATIAGGKGNDTIQINSTTNTNLLLVDRAGNVTDGDGNDSITTNSTVIGSTVYGGAGNDSITWSGVAGPANLISLNKGNDVYGKRKPTSTIRPFLWVPKRFVRSQNAKRLCNHQLG